MNVQAKPTAGSGAQTELRRGALQMRNWRHDWGTRTLIMGIVNVTPDSFSGDGVLEPKRAVAQALAMTECGADVIDLGAQSTRPGHQAIRQDEELERLMPVLTLLRSQSDCIVSIDTTDPHVLKTAVQAGADILNSIWGLTDALMSVVAELRIPVVLMHNKERAVYAGDVIEEVVETLARQAEKAMEVGIARERIVLDPGIGFGKTAEHNLLVLNGLDRLVALGFPTLLGASRKSFIGKLTGKPAGERVFGTAATTALAVAHGVDMVRVHDVSETKEVLDLADAILRGCRPAGWSYE
jgi:dihydropteroate synthase